MDLRITGDFSDDANIEQVLLDLSGITKSHFAKINYGSGLLGMGLVLICHDSREYKPRIRWSKKESRIYVDIVLSFDAVFSANIVGKKKIIKNEIINNVPQIIKQYKLINFDCERFILDLKNWLSDYAK